MERGYQGRHSIDHSFHTIGNSVEAGCGQLESRDGRRHRVDVETDDPRAATGGLDEDRSAPYEGVQHNSAVQWNFAEVGLPEPRGVVPSQRQSDKNAAELGAKTPREPPVDAKKGIGGLSLSQSKFSECLDRKGLDLQKVSHWDAEMNVQTFPFLSVRGQVGHP
jgi:hypothetical protein